MKREFRRSRAALRPGRRRGRSARGAGRAASPRAAAPFACALCLAALVALSGCSGGWGTVAQSCLDRLTPGPAVRTWAPTPSPESYADSYADATGAGTNYVYRVTAADAEGSVRELSLVSFGSKASGEGWLAIEAKGGSGLRYDAVEEDAVPAPARAALASDGRDGGR